MKTLSIFLIICFITLNAKADWMKTGELESLPISDSNFTFAKVNDEGTEIVTLSKSENKLRLWDLTSGKLIRELAMPYNCYKYDYNFNLDRFYFVINLANGINDPTLPKVDKPVAWMIDSTGVLSKIPFNYEEFVNEDVIEDVLSLKILKNTVYCHIIYKQINNTDTNYKENLQILYNNPNPSFVSYWDRNANLEFYSFKDGFFSFNGNKYLRKNNSIIKKLSAVCFNVESSYDIGIDDNIQNIKYSDSSFHVLDISNGYMTCSDDGKKNIKFLTLGSQKLNSVYRYPKGNITNFSLISRIYNAAYFRENDTLVVYDVMNKLEIDKFKVKKGYIAYSNINKMLYTFSGNLVYRFDVSKYNFGTPIFSTNKRFYYARDSVTITSNLPKLITNIMFEVNGEKFYGRTFKTYFAKLGFYGIKVSYLENGKQVEYYADSVIKVIDKFKPVLKVTHPNQNMYTIPFTFAVTSNFKDEEISYSFKTKETYVQRSTWAPYDVKEVSYKDVNLVGQNITYSFAYTGNYQFTLICNNGNETIELIGSVTVRPFCSFSLNKYSGNAPLTVTLKSNYYDKINYGPQFLENWGQTLLIGDIRINSNTFTIDKPGIYPVKFELRNDQLKRTEIYFENQVLTVYDPTDIEYFTQKKYIFKQDADGIYCQLDGEGEISLYDNVGRLVRTYQIENERYILKEDLERGVYFLSIQTNSNVYHEKVLVE